MNVKIEEVVDKKAIKSFIDFPHDLYKDAENYVPELYIAQYETLSRKKNPFFEHSDAKLFLAKRDGKVVGRIAAVVNNNYNAYHNSNVGFFGFFDTIDDRDVSTRLFDQAIDWLKPYNFDQIIGPTNFTTNDPSGMLVEGFELPPQVMMTYNFPYYQDHVEAYGFTKEMDLFAYKIPTKTASDKSIKMYHLLEERLGRKNITLRHINLRNFKQEVELIKTIYNRAWEKNWGFVPSTDNEFNHLAEGLKMVASEKYAFIVEHDGKPIAFLLAIPNINEITINIKRGRLFPTGIFKLLMGKGKEKTVRVATLGVIEDYRKLGIEGLLYAKIILAARENNLDYGEASWILESNDLMVKGIEKLNGELYKRYRLYSKKI